MYFQFGPWLSLLTLHLNSCCIIFFHNILLLLFSYVRSNLSITQMLSCAFFKKSLFRFWFIITIIFILIISICSHIILLLLEYLFVCSFKRSIILKYWIILFLRLNRYFILLSLRSNWSIIFKYFLLSSFYWSFIFKYLLLSSFDWSLILNSSLNWSVIFKNSLWRLGSLNRPLIIILISRWSNLCWLLFRVAKYRIIIFRLLLKLSIILWRLYGNVIKTMSLRVILLLWFIFI